MNVIFLDIDGVLNSSNYTKRYKEIQTKKERTYKNIDDSALNYLQKLQNKYNAKIVLISTWRKWGKSISIDKFKKSIKKNPITENERAKDYANLRTLYEKIRLEYDLDLDDMTDDLQNRMLEIQLYLLLHKEIEKFVILDDNDENFTEMFEEQFVQCCTEGESFGEKEFIRLKQLFDQELDVYRLENTRNRIYKPHITLCTNDNISQNTYDLAHNIFHSFVGEIKYIWVYHQNMELIKEYELK